VTSPSLLEVGSPLTPAEYGEQADLSILAEIEDSANPLIELGTTGLRRSGGYVDEEFLPQLRGRKSVQVYREMGDNDAITGALLFTIQNLIRNVDWAVVPAGKSAEHAKAAKFLESCMDDMSHTWDDFILEALTAVQYGWAWHEIVYKRRVSPWSRDGSTRSKYTDGLYSWKRLPIRSHETLQRWVFDEYGGVRGMVQLAAPDYKTRYLPIEKSLLFRHGVHKGNPEGRSALRTSYRAWYYKKRLEEFEAVGVERDLAGLPMVTVPADYLRAEKMSEQGKMVEAMRKLVRSVRRNEQEGIVFPAQFDRDGKNPLFKMELLGSGGARQYNTNELINRYEQRQLMTMLADWIMVGHQGNTGTYNLHVDKTGVFRAGINSVPQAIGDVLNRYAVPRLFALNGWRMAELPKFQPSDVDSPDLTQLASFMTATAGLGYSWHDADMERFLRHAAGMPELGDDDYSKRRQLARREEATRIAETQTAYLVARSTLAQTQAQDELVMNGEPTPEEAAQHREVDMANQQQQAAGEDAKFQRSQAQQQGRLSLAQAAVDMETKLRQSENPSRGTGNTPRSGNARGSKGR
jgi:hypothetical protein